MGALRKIAANLTAAALVVWAVPAVGGAGGGAEAPGATGSLPAAINGVAPGPEILHRDVPRAPQFENTGVWRAEPTKVCLTSAYRSGEFLYQDCLWDDNGGGPTWRWYYYTYEKNYDYPSAEAYRRNAADLVEIRLKPLDDATAIRITYNTMVDPELVATTVALGGTGEPAQAPHGANTTMPGEVFVTVHGSTGDIVDASGRSFPGTPAVTTDIERRQVEVRVPYSAFDPTGNPAVRVSAASGLWDTKNDRYLLPRQGLPTATEPGGARSDNPSAFFNVAFRYDEPHENAAWRNLQQNAAVVKADISDFFAIVDFTKLAAGADDDMTGQRGGVPSHGYMSLVFPSHFESRQGRRLPGDPGGPPAGSFSQQNGFSQGESRPGARPTVGFGWPCRDGCVPDLAGQLQRYLLYVPETPAPPGGYGILLWLNGFAINANDQVGSDDLWQSVAERPDQPTLVVGTDARGADAWGYGQMAASVFENWADVGRRYPLDPLKTAIGGFSSGAYSANKIALQFPDAFGRAFICDGLDVAPSFPGANSVTDNLPVDTLTVHEPGSRVSEMLPSRHNQPVMEWAGIPNDFIPYNITRARADIYAKGDYDYEFVSWAGGLAQEHLTMCNNGTWSVLNRWLGDMERVVDPRRVVFVRNPLMDDPESGGIIGDKAYWVSGIATRDKALGTVDVTSGGFGLGSRPVPERTAVFESVASDGVTLGSGYDQPDRRHQISSNPYLREHRRNIGTEPPGEASDTLVIKAKNISALTIDPQRAKVTCDAKLEVASDGPLTVQLLGCGGPQEFS